MRAATNRHYRLVDWDVGDMVYLDAYNLVVH